MADNHVSLLRVRVYLSKPLKVSTQHADNTAVATLSSILRGLRGCEFLDVCTVIGLVYGTKNKVLRHVFASSYCADV